MYLCKTDLDRIQEFLKERVGETRGLSEWCHEINNTKINKMRITRRRLTKRELAYIFNRVVKKEFIIEYHSDPIQYAFHLTS